LTTSGDRPVTWRQRVDDLSWREIEQEVVILDLRSATYLRLNAAGSVLWHQLEAGATFEQMERFLSHRFGLEGEVAQRDVTAFVESCATKGLIERLEV
jgi:hypothetical protein